MDGLQISKRLKFFAHWLLTVPTRTNNYVREGIIPGLALLCATIVSFHRVNTTFDVSAVTDRVALTTSLQTVSLDWAIQDADVELGWNDSHELIKKAIFQPGSDVDILFQRIGHGDLTIKCHGRNGHSVGIMSIAGQNKALPDRALFKLRTPTDQSNAIYPVSGMISVGDVVKPLQGNAIRAVLRDGTVTPIGHSLFSDSRFKADSTSLEAGDEFAVDPESNAEGYGLIFVDDRVSINVTYRAAGEKGRVNRFGGTGFEIDISVFQRIKYDPMVQSLWAVFVFVTGLKILRSEPKGTEKK